VPAGIPPALVDRHAWLAGFKGASVTEIEIRHGALNRPEAAGPARFYFRDLSAVDSLEAAEQARYREPSPAGQVKLTALKNSIRESKLPVWDDWRSPQELGERVLRDFEQILDVLYPEGSEPDALEREAAEHDYFATSRRGTYVGRQEYFERLERHVES